MLIRVHPCAAPPLLPSVPSLNPTRKTHFAPIPQPHLSITHLSIRPPIPTFTPKSRSTKHSNTTTDPLQEPTGDDDDLPFPGAGDDLPFPGDGDDLPFPGAGEGDEDDFSSSPSAYREGEKDYDKDPEFADILGSFFDDPKKGQARMEERIRKKRNKMVHTKTGSAAPMTVIFNNFDFSNSYIWFEFYNVPLPKDVSLICDTIRSWHIVGRLGGCNSMNMQLSQSPLENKRPSYDAIQGANVTPTTFYNIGDLEVQDNLARLWVDIGTSEPLLLDVLINALSNISSDYVGIKQLVFGGKEFENWRENPTAEDPGFSTHKI